MSNDIEFWKLILELALKEAERLKEEEQNCGAIEH